MAEFENVVVVPQLDAQLRHDARTVHGSADATAHVVHHRRGIERVAEEGHDEAE